MTQEVRHELMWQLLKMAHIAEHLFVLGQGQGREDWTGLLSVLHDIVFENFVEPAAVTDANGNCVVLLLCFGDLP